MPQYKSKTQCGDNRRTNRKVIFMRKFMNNHFSNSRIFGKHARFVVAPDGNADVSESLDGDLDGSGNGSGTSEVDTDITDDADNSESIELIKAELAKAKADAERYKNSISKQNKQIKELTDKNKSLMTADQLETEAQEARERRFAEMEKELRTNKYSKRLVGVGMAEADADAFAATMPEFEDADSFFDKLGAFVKGREKVAVDKAIQDLLKSRPDIHAGNGDSDKDDPAMMLAKASIQKSNNNFNGESQDILKNYM
jgi:hypothetical protein